jgi:hypothetical protein
MTNEYEILPLLIVDTNRPIRSSDRMIVADREHHLMGKEMICLDSVENKSDA